MDPGVIVVGAGVAGLTCARELRRRRVPCVVLEGSHEVGGRCATRWIEGQAVDHGVPFLHATTGEFGEELNELDPDGKISGWPLRVREPRLAWHPDAFRPGHRRLARIEGANEFARFLAREVDVRFDHPAVTIREDRTRLTIRVAGGGSFHASLLVVATRLDQSVRLLEPLVAGWPGAADQLEAMRKVRPIPTLTVIAGYRLDSPDPGFDLWYPVETTMLHAISHDSTKRRAPRFRVLVLHARPGYSEENRERRTEEWVGELLWEAAEVLGPWAMQPAWTQAHAWESARVRPRDVFGSSAVFESPRGARIAVVGDAFAPHAGVEGAWLSGIAMGELIATLPQLQPVVRPPLTTRRMPGRAAARPQ